MTNTLDSSLAELTATLVRDVFSSIANAAVEQVDSYVALAGEVGMPVELYQQKILGLSAADKAENVAEYIREIVLPLLALPTNKIPSMLYFADAPREAFLVHFARVVVDVDVDGEPKLATDLVIRSKNVSYPWQLTRAHLEALVTAKILRDAAADHARATILLRAGFPNVVVTGGQICTKVTMSLSETAPDPARRVPGLPAKGRNASNGQSPLGMRVRIANERSLVTSKSVEMVGSVRIDFRAGTFPPIDPGAASR